MLSLDKVKWIEEVPNYTELSSQNIWKEVQKDKKIALYFPEYSKSRAPQKKFLLNIVNTIKPNSIAEAVKKLRKMRKDKELDENPIVITEEYM